MVPGVLRLILQQTEGQRISLKPQKGMESMKMAKVITMNIKLNNNGVMNLVTTVDPSVTPEMFLSVYKVNGKLMKSETSMVMPLPYALAYSHSIMAKFGII